ncbi:MAG TPA: DUF5597 domain-containing protein [Opitutaceae bacterium]|nr:DUF5597 domain-containing protein [Opitutaceae bacterium]
MKTLPRFSPVLPSLLALFVAGSLARSAPPPIPRLEKRGPAVQLIVDGQPYLVLAGETANTASSSLEYMDTVWPKLVEMNLNTVLVAVAWDWVEPVEGRYDFTLVDGLLAGARHHHLRLVLLWFGSWKNGISSFVPGWVKADQARFPRTQIKSGQSVEILSTLSDANRQADTRAYVAFLHHLREVDAAQRTVVMIQLENEVGLLGDSRDRCAAAEAAFAHPVPAELTAHLQKNRETLWPDLRKLWETAGARTAGTWSEVFGPGTATDEIFMAWNYARYLGHLTEAGKAEYPLPVFTNSWIVQPEDKGPGDYPTGCPEPLTLDIWKAGAPAIDLNAPDIYLPNFTDWVGWYHRANNPLFVPESRGDAGGAANAFYAIGQHAAIGYSPFGIDNTGRLVALRPDRTTPAPTELKDLPLPKAYALLAQMTPVILDAQARGAIAAAWLNPKQPTQDIPLGNYLVNVDLRRNRRNPAEVPALGYAIVISTGPDEFLVAGQDVQVTFKPTTPGPEIAGLERVEAGKFVQSRWIPGRILSGDDILLDYDLAGAAAKNQSGSGLRFGADGPTVQRVKLYRYR